jgi:hypothetical protein
MKRRIIATRIFSKVAEDLIKKHKLRQEDLNDLKKELVKDPEKGDLISGTGGVRKTRLKSASKGKRGGFRVCYYDDVQNEELFLLVIYQKNEQEDLSADEKKALRAITDAIKGG